MGGQAREPGFWLAGFWWRAGAASWPWPLPLWSESLLPAMGLARIIACDSLHRLLWSPALSAPRPILEGLAAPAHFHAVAAPPWQDSYARAGIADR